MVTRRSPQVGLGLIAAAALGAALGLWGTDYASLESAPYLAPSAEHWLGTDVLGRDLFARSLQAAQVSLGVGLASALATVGLGAVLGLSAGLAHRRHYDRALQILADAIASVPPILAIFGLSLALGPGPRSAVLAIALTQWPAVYRSARTEARRLRNEIFVQASRAMGAKLPWLLRHHILPNLRPWLTTTGANYLAWAIQVEALLSFLGRGHPDLPSWGLMLAEAGSEIARGLWWPTLAAAVPLCATVYWTHQLADAATDPG